MSADRPAAAAVTPDAEVDRLCRAAAASAPVLEAMGRSGRAGLLTALGHALEADRAGIVAQADRETSLGAARLNAELTRTRMQLEHFAGVLTEGSYLEATIDHRADTPIGPRPDLRRMLVPTGPVAVFGASNFPLAFSVPGGDTASALAAGCPVVIKAHPAHPATSLRCFHVMREVVRERGVSPDILALVHGHEAGQALVQHPSITAVGFTGSTAGGRALFDLACARPVPIPFYGELGSLNPLIVTPAAATERGAEIAAGLTASMTLGTGQFCTKPGLIFVPDTDGGHRLVDELRRQVTAAPAGAMLSAGIHEAYQRGVEAWRRSPGVSVVAEASVDGQTGPLSAKPALFRVEAADLSPATLDERFGPAALLVPYQTTDHLTAVLARLGGQLTVSVHCGQADEHLLAQLHTALRATAGRIVFNGYPTGVAVTWAQQHGGPYPATTSALHTSVGATSIRRWLRPVVYQDAPAAVLPAELAEGEASIPRRVDGDLVVPNRPPSAR